MDSEQEKLRQKLFKDWVADFERNPEEAKKDPEKIDPREELQKMLNEAAITREVRSHLVKLRSQAEITQEEIEFAREVFRKDKARKHRQIEITKRKKILAEEEAAIRADRSIKKLQKMQMIRKIQELRANL